MFVQRLAHLKLVDCVAVAAEQFPILVTNFHFKYQSLASINLIEDNFYRNEVWSIRHVSWKVVNFRFVKPIDNLAISFHRFKLQCESRFRPVHPAFLTHVRARLFWFRKFQLATVEHCLYLCGRFNVSVQLALEVITSPLHVVGCHRFRLFLRMSMRVYFPHLSSLTIHL